MPFETDRDRTEEDPQRTMPPRKGEARRIVVPPPRRDQTSPAKGPGLKLGTPTRMPAADPGVQAPEATNFAKRGFNLGAEPVAERVAVSKAGVQPWILYLAGGAALLLVVALVFGGSSSGASAEAVANEKLLAQYTKYLDAKGPNSQIDVTERKKEVVGRLQAIAWAKAIGDEAALHNELSGLLFLDNDKNSPLYQYSVQELKLID